MFSIGAVGVLVRRNPLVMFMCIELMLNAVNLSFVALAHALGDIGGQTAVFFVLVVAAAEVVVGLGIIVSILRRRPAPPPTTCRVEGLRWRRDGRRRLADPCLPLPGSCSLLLLGRRLGDPKAGYLATAMVVGVVRRLGRRVLRPARSSRRGAALTSSTLFPWLPVGTCASTCRSSPIR